MIKNNWVFYNDNGMIEGEVVTMPYRNYKLHYADCKKIPDSYDAVHKTIDVIVPEGREKKSGTRGRQYDYFPAWFHDKVNKWTYVYYFKAMSNELAEKQVKKYLKLWKGEVERITKQQAEKICRETGKEMGYARG